MSAIEYGIDKEMPIHIGRQCDFCKKKEMIDDHKKSQYIKCPDCQVVRYCSKTCLESHAFLHKSEHCEVFKSYEWKLFAKTKHLTTGISYLAVKKQFPKDDGVPILEISFNINDKEANTSFRITLFKCDDHKKMTYFLQDRTFKQELERYHRKERDLFILIVLYIRGAPMFLLYSLDDIADVFSEYSPKDYKKIYHEFINTLNRYNGVKLITKNLQKIY